MQLRKNLNYLNVKNILFDLGNVLFRLDLDLWRHEVKTLLDPVDPLELQSAAIDYETGQISTELFINAVLSKCHHRYQAQDVIKVWNSMLLGLVPEYLQVLSALKENYRVYLLSNNNPMHQKWMYDDLDNKYHIKDFNSRFFHHTFYSHEIGHRKPDKESFLTVIQTTGIIPEETIYFDDDPTNISAGRQMGFQSIQVRDADHTLELLVQHGFQRAEARRQKSDRISPE